jgi:hypothetical protein
MTPHIQSLDYGTKNVKSMKTRISAPLPRDQESGNVPERPSLDPGHLGKEDAIL